MIRQARIKHGLELLRKPPIGLGLLLLVVGLGLRWFIELTLVPDHHLVLLRYVVAVAAVQLVLIAAGLFLLIKRPALRAPSKTELLLPLISLGLTFLALEIGARLWLAYLATPDQRDRFVLYTSIAPQDFAWTPHPYLTYYPTPNYRKGLTSHNSLGYRNDEFPLAKPSGVFRIAVIGGSSTYDVRIEDNAKTFTAQLEKLLKTKYGYSNVQVINAGVPGYNSYEMLVNLEFRVIDLDPDLVIAYEGTNDVHTRFVEPDAFRGDDTGRRQPWQAPPVPWWEQSTLLRILSRQLNFTRQVSVDDFVSSPTYWGWPYDDRLTEDNRDPYEILKENPPTYIRRNYEDMIAIAQAHGVGILFTTWAYSPYRQDYAAQPYYQQGFAENNAVVSEVAQSRHIPLFDFAAVMPQDPQYWADGRHVNEAGAVEKAELFAEYLTSQGLIHH
jgi:lysophospholipase L1-like esterase